VLAKGKGVHREVESEGSRKLASAYLKRTVLAFSRETGNGLNHKAPVSPQGKVFPWKQLKNGHNDSSSVKILYFYTMNVRFYSNMRYITVLPYINTEKTGAKLLRI
jgi:hypothetical protein